MSVIDFKGVCYLLTKPLKTHSYLHTVLLGALIKGEVGPRVHIMEN